MHSVDEHKSQGTDRRERAIGVVLLVLGLLVAGGALLKIHRQPTQLAQAEQNQTAPEQYRSAPVQQDSKPAEAMPGGTRPTTPAPEPARPQTQPGQTTGTAPPLPPAPAEKIAPPMNAK